MHISELVMQCNIHTVQPWCCCSFTCFTLFLPHKCTWHVGVDGQAGAGMWEPARLSMDWARTRAQLPRSWVSYSGYMDSAGSATHTHNTRHTPIAAGQSCWATAARLLTLGMLAATFALLVADVGVRLLEATVTEATLTGAPPRVRSWPSFQAANRQGHFSPQSLK